MFSERLFGLGGDERRVNDSLVRGFGSVIAFVGFGAASFFGEEFDGGAKEVVEESPFVAVQVIEEGDDLGVIESFVSEPLADVGPVFFVRYGRCLRCGRRGCG